MRKLYVECVYWYSRLCALFGVHYQRLNGGSCVVVSLSLYTEPSEADGELIPTLYDQ